MNVKRGNQGASGIVNSSGAAPPTNQIYMTTIRQHPHETTQTFNPNIKSITSHSQNNNIINPPNHGDTTGVGSQENTNIAVGGIAMGQGLSQLQNSINLSNHNSLNLTQQKLLIPHLQQFSENNIIALNKGNSSACSVSLSQNSKQHIANQVPDLNQCFKSEDQQQQLPPEPINQNNNLISSPEGIKIELIDDYNKKNNSSNNKLVGFAETQDQTHQSESGKQHQQNSIQLSRQAQNIFNLITCVFLALMLSVDIQLLAQSYRYQDKKYENNEKTISVELKQKQQSEKEFGDQLEKLTFVVVIKCVVMIIHICLTIITNFCRNSTQKESSNSRKANQTIFQSVKLNNQFQRKAKYQQSSCLDDYDDIENFQSSDQILHFRTKSSLDLINLPWLVLVYLIAMHASSFVILHSQVNLQNDGAYNNGTAADFDFTMVDLVQQEFTVLLALNLFGIYFMLPMALVLTLNKACGDSKKLKILVFAGYICGKIYPIIQIYMYLKVFSRESVTKLLGLSAIIRYFLLELSHFHCLIFVASNYRSLTYSSLSNNFLSKADKETVEIIKFIEKKRSLRNTQRETEELLEKLPEGILIVNDEGQVVFMNSELSQVMNIVSHEDQQEGLKQKIFTKYFEGEEENNNEDNESKGSPKINSTRKIGDNIVPKKEWQSLQDMIDDVEWTFDQDRYFEMVLDQSDSANVENEDIQKNEDNKSEDSKVFTQVRKLDIHYQERPAKMLVIRNITFIIEYEKVRNENRYQELLTATMSHEMLTPLNSIINLSIFVESKLRRKFNLIENGDGMASDGSRGIHHNDANHQINSSNNTDIRQALSFIHIIKSSANILQYLVKDLIDLMNIKLNKFNANSQPFSPMDACQEVLSCFEIQAREKNLFLKKRLIRENQDKIIEVMGDKQRYQQILLNIIQNGVKFTYVGGVDVILDFQQTVEYTSNNEGCSDCGELLTIVKDTGCGMDQTLLNRLFRIFGTVNNYSDQQTIITTQGIGLGLTICKQLCEKLGGQITVTSTPMEGTDVTFSIPFQCKYCQQQKQQKLKLEHSNSALSKNLAFAYSGNEEMLQSQSLQNQNAHGTNNHPNAKIEQASKQTPGFPKREFRDFREKVSAMCLATLNNAIVKKQPFGGDIGGKFNMTINNGFQGTSALHNGLSAHNGTMNNQIAQSYSAIGYTPKSRITDKNSASGNGGNGKNLSPRSEFEKFSQQFGRTAEIAKTLYRDSNNVQSQEIHRGPHTVVNLMRSINAIKDPPNNANNHSPMGQFRLPLYQPTGGYHLNNQSKYQNGQQSMIDHRRGSAIGMHGPMIQSNAQYMNSKGIANPRQRTSSRFKKSSSGSKRNGNVMINTLQNHIETNETPVNRYRAGAASMLGGQLAGERTSKEMFQNLVSDSKLIENGSEYFFSSHCYSVNDKMGQKNFQAKIQKGTHLVHHDSSLSRGNNYYQNENLGTGLARKQKSRNYIEFYSKSSCGNEDLSFASINKEHFQETPKGVLKRNQDMHLVFHCRENDLQQLSKQDSKQKRRSSSKKKKSVGIYNMISIGAFDKEEEYDSSPYQNAKSAPNEETKQNVLSKTPGSLTLEFRQHRNQSPKNYIQRNSPFANNSSNSRENSGDEALQVQRGQRQQPNFLAIINDEVELTTQNSKLKQGTACFNSGLDKAQSSSNNFNQPSPSLDNKQLETKSLNLINKIGQTQLHIEGNHQKQKPSKNGKELSKRDFTLALQDVGGDNESQLGSSKRLQRHSPTNNQVIGESLRDRKISNQDVGYEQSADFSRNRLPHEQFRQNKNPSREDNTGLSLFMQVPKTSNHSQVQECSPNFPNNISNFPTIREQQRQSNKNQPLQNSNDNNSSSVGEQRLERIKNSLPAHSEKISFGIKSSHDRNQMEENYNNLQGLSRVANNNTVQDSGQQQFNHDSRLGSMQPPPVPILNNRNNFQGTSPALLNNGARVQILGNPPPVVLVTDNSNNNQDSSDQTTNNQGAGGVGGTGGGVGLISRMETSEEEKEGMSQYPGLGLNDAGESSDDAQNAVGLVHDSVKIVKQCNCESTILIVDDNMFNLIPLELILTEHFRIKVDKALNGQEAVAIYSKNLYKTCCNVRYRLILMDLNMPIMDGYEATTHILALFQRKQQSLMQQPNFNSRVSQLSDLQQQQNPSRNGSANNHDGPNSNANSRSQGGGGAAAVLLPSKIHVVAVTAFQNDENIRLCYRVGMTDVMHKPISIDGMKRCLDQFYYNVQ